jgi:adenylate kinase
MVAFSTSDTMRIIILGPPGAGKGTEAELLIKQFGIPHISTGDMFRNLFKGDSEIGKRAKSYIDKGELVPDDITNELVAKRLGENDVKNGFLFDGYPRTRPQAEALDQIFNEKKVKLNAIININASDETIIARLAGRRVCPTCGAIYHIITKKPKQAGICDNDGAKLIQRLDDHEDTIKKRLTVYHTQTEPVLRYYEHSGLLVHIDGSGDFQKTHLDVMKVLGDQN